MRYIYFVEMNIVRRRSVLNMAEFIYRDFVESVDEHSQETKKMPKNL